MKNDIHLIALDAMSLEIKPKKISRLKKKNL
jgi:hypothetical protein